MANTENLGVALARGYQIGRSTGGKLSGLGQIIGKVADRLKSQRELGEQLNLLGQTERIKSMYDPQTRMINTLFGGGEGTISSVSGETPTQDTSVVTPDKLRRGLIAKMTGVPFEQMMTGEEREEELQRYVEKETLKGEAMATRERLKKRKEADVNFEIARNKLRVTAASFKAMQEKAGGEGFLPATSAAFGGTKLGRMLRINPYTKAYQGQLVEAASSLAKLAAPSARVGQEIITQFKNTLPDVWSIANPGEFQNQIRFSLHNAFGTALANAGDVYSPEIRNRIDTMVDELIDVPSMSLEDLNRYTKGLSIDESKYSPIKNQDGFQITPSGNKYRIIQ